MRLGVYFDQMILKIIPKITIFMQKLMILPARLLYEVFKLPEKILKNDQHFDVYFDKIWNKK